MLPSLGLPGYYVPVKDFWNYIICWVFFGLRIQRLRTIYHKWSHSIKKICCLMDQALNVSFILYFFFTLIEFLFIIFNVCLASVDIKYIVQKELKHWCAKCQSYISNCLCYLNFTDWLACVTFVRTNTCTCTVKYIMRLSRNCLPYINQTCID